MIAAVFMIGSCVLCGIYMLYKMFTVDSHHFVSMLAAVIVFFGLAATFWMMYLEFPMESIRTVGFGSLGVFGVLAPIGYVIGYVKSSRYQKAELRAKLRKGLVGLLVHIGIILILILVDWLYKLIFS
ncbi:hypothetical protein CBW65_22365 [Tumebacillus avium]|uniref:Uncharacterized protein n=1 Tax=Tumebacillus avium TaxID=1903704 RepID=A0A1Y0ISD7_9BACL|nr:hypothetical protein [Tumebacillus avium]ARU63431.1 hypothetical protein CBW65_22365 [Tumebacillus avium]